MLPARSDCLLLISNRGKQPVVMGEGNSNHLKVMLLEPVGWQTAAVTDQHQ